MILVVYSLLQFFFTEALVKVHLFIRSCQAQIKLEYQNKSEPLIDAIHQFESVNNFRLWAVSVLIWLIPAIFLIFSIINHA